MLRDSASLAALLALALPVAEASERRLELVVERAGRPAGVTVAVDGMTLPGVPADGRHQVSGLDPTASQTVSFPQPTGGNYPPRAVDDAATCTTGAVIDLSVLANDLDGDGDLLALILVGQPGLGAITDLGDGRLRYTAPVDSGLDSFNYAIADGRGGTDLATVRVEVTTSISADSWETDDDPASPSTVTLDSPQQRTLHHGGDTDWIRFDLAAATAVTIETPTPGNTALALYDDGGLVASDTNSGAGNGSRLDLAVPAGTYRLRVRANDGQATTYLLVVTSHPNRAPGLTDPGPVVVRAGGPVTIDLTGAASDGDGDPLVISAIGTPDHGSASAAGLVVTYTPPSLWRGPDKVSVTIADPAGATASADLSILVFAGDGSDPYESDDSTSTAGTVEPGASQWRSLHDGSDHDHLVFTLARERQVVATTTSGSGDTTISLLDDSGAVVASATGIGGTTSLVRSLAAGTWFLRIEPAGSSPLASYHVSLTASGLVDGFEDDPTPSQAAPIAPGAAQVRSLWPAGDVDHVALVAPWDGSAVLSASAPAGNHPRIELLDRTGAVGVSAAGTLAVDLAAGLHIARLVADPADATVLDYTLGLSFVGLTAVDAFEADDGRPTAKDLAEGAPQVRSLHTAGDQDWVRLEVPTAERLVLATSAVAGDTRIELYDNGGALVASADDGAGGNLARLEADVTAGTWYARVVGSTSLARYALSRGESEDAWHPDSAENDDSRAAATAHPLGSTVLRTLHRRTDVDWSTVDLAAPARLVAVARTASANSVALACFDGSGRRLLAEPDQATSNRVNLDLPAGRYWLRVRGDAATAYVLTVDTGPVTGDDGFEVAEASVVLAAGTSQARFRTDPQDDELGRLDLPEAARVALTVNGPGGEGLALRDHNGHLVAVAGSELVRRLDAGIWQVVAGGPTAGAMTLATDIRLQARPSAPVLGAEVVSWTSDRLILDLDLAAIDANLALVTELASAAVTADAASVTVDGSPGLAGAATVIQVERRGWSPASGPLACALLIDRSGSISESDPADARITAGSAFLDRFQAGDEGLLAAFPAPNGESLWRFGPFTSDGERLGDDLASLAEGEGGTTPLYAALAAIATVVDLEAVNANRAVVCFTDGSDTDPDTDRDDAVDAATAAGVPLHLVGLGAEANQDELLEVAARTGGTALWTDDAGTLLGHFVLLAAVLREEAPVHRVEVVIDLDQPALAPGTVVTGELRVDLPGASGYRTRFWSVVPTSG